MAIKGRVKLLPAESRYSAKAIEPPWTLVLAACETQYVAFERWEDYREFLKEKHKGLGLRWAKSSSY